jgi:hypothetical protein
MDNTMLSKEYPGPNSNAIGRVLLVLSLYFSDQQVINQILKSSSGLITPMISFT